MLPPSAMPIIYKKSACWCDLISKYKKIDLSYYDEPMQCSGGSRGGSRGAKEPPFCQDPIDKTLQHST